MALTKQQKGTLIDQAEKGVSGSKSAVFSEFKGVTVEEFKKLRRDLKKVNADMKVVKKRLLRIALGKLGIAFDPMMMKEQMTAVYSKNDLSSVAPVLYKFSKEVAKGKKGNFAVLGAFDATDKRVVDVNEFKALATLPSREVLLAQIAMMLTMPLKQTMMVLNERAKKVEA
ncbi:MAG: 50S ribosomal protein L10 [Patescibacteria group bacterium]|nr:50S ribosomal protein L10 [Patescibacteria group bacterium]